MAIPDFQSFMRPLLVAVKDGQVHQRNHAFERVFEHFSLSEDDLNERLPSGNQTYVKNRISWARTYLQKAGLLLAPSRGYIQITERGIKAIEDCPEKVNTRYLKQYESFQLFHNMAPADTNTNEKSLVEVDLATHTDEKTDPQERLDTAHSEIQQSLIDELLSTIKQQTPQFLEKLVVELMQSMGYGGWSGDSGKVTQYSNDGGIDGIINEDPLGLDSIYLQAKRYTEQTVGRPDLQNFSGALDMHRAKKGVFITTSQFSNEAKEFVNKIDKKVVLIDGQQLAHLMIKHNLGVSIKNTYQVKAIDTDYFIED